MKVISNTEKNWFFAFDERNFLLRLFTTNINYINCFGNIEGNKNVCINNNSTVEYFDTEEELQVRVNAFAQVPTYYQDQMEQQTGVTVGPSILYPDIPIVPE